MKKLVAIALISFNLMATTTAQASPVIVNKKFANCAALNKVYKGGVARAAGVTNTGGATKYAPTVNAKVYKENNTKDRDGDGIVCEK